MRRNVNFYENVSGSQHFVDDVRAVPTCTTKSRTLCRRHLAEDISLRVLQSLKSQRR